jgi:hypothetical protein
LKGGGIMGYVIYDIDNHEKIMEIYDPHVLGTVITNLAVLGEMFNMQIQPVDYRVEESHEE